MVVLYEARGPVAWATLNRPEVLNATNVAMMQGLLDAVERTASNDQVRVLVVTGVGRAFSAGGDIKEMADAQGGNARGNQHFYQKLSLAMRKLEKPIIAAVNGYALGAGIEVALMCDLRIAAASAKFGVPDAHLGISPGGGMTYLLPRVLGMGRTMHIALTTDMVDAQEAERIGLVTQIVEDDKLVDHVQELAEQIASYPAQGLAFMKRAFYSASESSFSAALALEEEYDVASFSSPETQQALNAFLESRGKRKAK